MRHRPLDRKVASGLHFLFHSFAILPALFLGSFFLFPANLTTGFWSSVRETLPSSHAGHLVDTAANVTCPADRATLVETLSLDHSPSPCICTRRTIVPPGLFSHIAAYHPIQSFAQLSKLEATSKGTTDPPAAQRLCQSRTPRKDWNPTNPITPEHHWP